jgi:hypothetical protein
MVVRRQVARPRYAPSDRMVLAMMARLLPRERWPVFLVTPATLLRWHRELVARRWTYPATGQGRQGLDREVVDLAVRMARENPQRGYVRIVGECRKLGVRVSATSVRRILHRHQLGPTPRRSGPSWTAFLRSQADVIVEPIMAPTSEDRVDPRLVNAVVLVAAGVVDGRRHVAAADVGPCPVSTAVAALADDLSYLSATFVNHEIHGWKPTGDRPSLNCIPSRRLRPAARTTWTKRARSGCLRWATDAEGRWPASWGARVPGRVALAAGGRIRVVGPEALPAGGIVRAAIEGLGSRPVGLRRSPVTTATFVSTRSFALQGSAYSGRTHDDQEYSTPACPVTRSQKDSETPGSHDQSPPEIRNPTRLGVRLRLLSGRHETTVPELRDNGGGLSASPSARSGRVTRRNIRAGVGDAPTRPYARWSAPRVAAGVARCDRAQRLPTCDRRWTCVRLVAATAANSTATEQRRRRRAGNGRTELVASV